MASPRKVTIRAYAVVEASGFPAAIHRNKKAAALMAGRLDAEDAEYANDPEAVPLGPHQVVTLTGEAVVHGKDKRKAKR